MGAISSKLKKRFSQLQNRKIVKISEMSNAKKMSAEAQKTINTFDELIAKGYDPVHAVYVNTQNLLSLFAEQFSVLPEMEIFHDIMEKAEDMYCPSGPPMSPLTGSYYTLWAFSDFRFGKDKESITSCFIDLADIIRFSPMNKEAAILLDQSRMGLYEHSGIDGKLIVLKELLTKKVHKCLCPSGYHGRKGELWYVRLADTPMANLAYSIVLTTPYILVEMPKIAWIDYFERNLITTTTVGMENRLHRLMKFGKSWNYWNEYVFQAYVNHRSDVIYLTGIPDLPKTLPHAPDELKESNGVGRNQLCPCGSGKKYKRCCLGITATV
ncbi:SEC-C domain-containing protein [Acidobacteria bacterium AH-259-L09]|nr:SEC-C domain-containing protein [Acidobacteria bacterium AH-259-L09]